MTEDVKTLSESLKERLMNNAPKDWQAILMVQLQSVYDQGRKDGFKALKKQNQVS